MRILIFTLFIITNVCSFAQTPNLWGLSLWGGEENIGTIFKTNLDGSVKKQMHSFKGQRGESPSYNNVVETAPGIYYGAVNNGGKYGKGVLFKYDSNTKNYQVLIDFDGTNGETPYGLTKHSNGKLYGVTNLGGAHSNGVLYSVDVITNSFNVLFEFDETVSGSMSYTVLTEGTDGLLYGFTSQGGIYSMGVCYNFNVSTNTYTKIVDLDGTMGAYPIAKFTLADNGKMYAPTPAGGANNVGTILEYDFNTHTLTKKLDMNSPDVYGLSNSLLNASNGKLYGVSEWGGVDGNGTLFEYDPDLNTFTSLFSLDISGNDGLGFTSTLFEGATGKLYGITQYGGINYYGTFFEYDINTNQFLKISDLDLWSQNMNVQNTDHCDFIKNTNGKYVAFSTAGGLNAVGNLYEFDPSDYSFKNIFDFKNSITGQEPESWILASNQKFYGTTRAGGENYGAIFEFDPKTKKYSYKCSIKNQLDPTKYYNSPYGLLETPDNRILGLADNVIYEFNYQTSQVTILDTLEGGYASGNGLMYASDGNIYGMTVRGGSSDSGIIFRFNPITNQVTKLFDFGNINGTLPYATTLTEGANNKLYGTTRFGGLYGKGILFEYDFVTETFTKKLDFDDVNSGSRPTGKWVDMGNGIFYGTAYSGGANGKGLIYQYNTNNSTFTKKVDFGPVTENSRPYGAMIKASNNKLYGLGYGGGNNGKGIVYVYDTLTNNLSKLIDLEDVQADVSVAGSLIESNVCSNSEATIAISSCDTYLSPSGKTWTITGVYNDTILNATGCDSILTVNLTINNSYTLNISDSICDGGVYHFGSQTLNIAGTYTEQLTAINGCDSTIILTLKVNLNPVVLSSSDNSYTCGVANASFWVESPGNNSYQWYYAAAGYLDSAIIGGGAGEINFNTDSMSIIDLQSNGYYGFTVGCIITNESGCTTIAPKDTIFAKLINYVQDTICENSVYPFNGTFISAAGNYVGNYISAGNCDSIVYLTLVTKQASSSIDYVEACDSIQWIDGNVYYANNNSATYLLINSIGCDSVVTLNLTMHYSSNSTDTSATACESFNWYGNIYNTSGDYTRTIASVIGACDSTITLHLTINNSNTSILNETACDSIVINNQTYYISGTYTQTLINSMGCDSVLTINLTVGTTPIVLIDSVNGANSNGTLCAGGSYQLYASPNGGVFSGFGVVGNELFPDVFGSIDSIEVIYSYTDIDGCSNSDTAIYLVDICTGYEDVEFLKTNIQPNPVKDNCLITFNKSINNLQIKVLDALGKEVYNSNQQNRLDVNLNMNEFLPGIYFIELNADGNKIYQKLIKE